MAKNYSTDAIRQMNSVAADDLPLTLLEIDHPALVSPARFVIDKQDLVSNGDTFTAIAAEIKWPDDMSQGQPRAEIVVDNIGRDLTDWIEASVGGRGASYRFMHVLRSAPNVIQADTTLSGSNVVMTMTTVSATLGYEDILNLPAVTVIFSPQTAPGLY